MTETIILTRGVPANESFAIDALIGCAEQALKRYGTTILQYHPPRGFVPLRETGTLFTCDISYPFNTKKSIVENPTAIVISNIAAPKFRSFTIS